MSKESKLTEKADLLGNREYYLVNGLVFFWPGIGDGVYPLMTWEVDEEGRPVLKHATEIPKHEADDV